jgi:hypothetical protein
VSSAKKETMSPALTFLWLAAVAGLPCIGADMRSCDPWNKAGADEGLRQAFENARYSLEDAGHGTYRGENPRQRLTLEFDGQETRLSHTEGSVALHLTGYGYGRRFQTPARAKVTSTGNRLEYQRGDLTEWYLNGSHGLEQGFTLAHRPETDREGEPLVIALGVSGGLVPAPNADEDSVLFQSSEGVVLRYAGLRAWDASGCILSSRLEVLGREIRLIVENHDAPYPLVVDPTWTQRQHWRIREPENARTEPKRGDPGGVRKESTDEYTYDKDTCLTRESSGCCCLGAGSFRCERGCTDDYEHNHQLLD